MLILPIKKKWFDMIKSGEKKEEYREIKSYYTSRFNFEDEIKNGKILKTVYSSREILLRNGYSNNSPTIKCRVIIKKGYGKEEWGAEPNKLYYVLRILDVKEIK